MIFIEGLLFLLGFYLLAGISAYVYIVFKYYEFTGTWNFNIENGLISDVFIYPKWSLFWLEWIVTKFKNRGKRNV